MYRRWPFWQTLIDNAQMILAKADMTIARLYADLVDDPALADAIFGRISEEYRRTVGVVGRITGQSTLLEKMPILERSIQQRNPYVDPLSFIQLVLLRASAPRKARTRTCSPASSRASTGSLPA